MNKEIPILNHANAGEPVLQEMCTVFPESPEKLASFATKLTLTGPNIFGGCCGTTPEHIRLLAKYLKKID